MEEADEEVVDELDGVVKPLSVIETCRIALIVGFSSGGCFDSIIRAWGVVSVAAGSSLAGGQNEFERRVRFERTELSLEDDELVLR